MNIHLSLNVLEICLLSHLMTNHFDSFIHYRIRFALQHLEGGGCQSIERQYNSDCSIKSHTLGTYS